MFRINVHPYMFKIERQIWMKHCNKPNSWHVNSKTSFYVHKILLNTRFRPFSKFNKVILIHLVRASINWSRYSTFFCWTDANKSSYGVETFIKFYLLYIHEAMWMIPGVARYTNDQSSYEMICAIRYRLPILYPNSDLKLNIK